MLISKLFFPVLREVSADAKLKSNSLGLQITFAAVYIVIVSSLILLSSMYAINIANKISRPIIKLIFAAKEVSVGNLEVKLKYEEEDDDFKKLYQTFNTSKQLFLL